MSDAPHQAHFIRLIVGRLPQVDGLRAVHGDFVRRKTFGRVEQLCAHLRDQADRSGHGDVGDDVGGVFQSQAIFDQPGATRLAHDLLKDGFKIFIAEPGAKLREQARFGQDGVARQIQKEAEGEIDLHLAEESLIGQAVMTLEEDQLDDQDGIPRHAPSLANNNRRPGCERR